MYLDNQMWRKTARVIFLGLAIVGVGVIAFLGWLTSSSFDRFAAARIKHELARFNIRARIGWLDVRPFDLILEVRNARLFAADDRRAFLEISRLTADFNIADLFNRRFELHRLDLERPAVSLRFDQTGHSNIEAIDISSLQQKEEQPGPQLVIGQIIATEGMIEYQHQQYHLDGQARDLELNLSPEADGARLVLTAANSFVHLDEREIDDAGIELNALVNQDGAQIRHLRLVTPFTDTDLSGALRNWSDPEYEADLTATLDLSQLARDLNLGLSLAGAAQLTGRLTGQAERFRLTGTISSPELSASGVRVTALQFQAQAGANGEAPASGQSSETAPFWLQGLLQSDRIRPGLLELRSFRGSVFMTPERIEVKHFLAAAWRGRVAGDAMIQFSHTSTIDANFQSVSLHQAVAEMAGGELPLDGTISGAVRLRWPATDFARAAGGIQLNIESLASTTNDLLPVSGTVTAHLNPRGVNVTASHITVGTAEADLSGDVAWKTGLNLRVETTVNDLAEQERLLAALNIDLGAMTRGVVTSLSGAGHFSVHIQGPANQLRLSGVASIRELVLNSGTLTSGQAAFEYHDHLLRLTETSARFDDGSRVALDRLQYDLKVENGMTIEGRADQINLSQWGDRLDVNIPVIGLITGEFFFTDLPGTPRGRAALTLTQGEIQAPHLTVPFDRLSGRVLIDERGYELRQAKIEKGPNVLTFSGKYQPQTGDYSIFARGLDLDVSTLDEALEKRGLPLTGRLDIQLAGRGKLVKPQFDARLNLAQLTIAGEEAGTLRGEIRGQQGDIHWRIISELFDQRQEVTGRFQPNDPAQPLTMKADLRQFKATPYLRLVADLPPDTGIVVSGQVDVAWPLAFPERRRTTATLTQTEITSGRLLLRNEQPLIVTLVGYQLDIKEVRFRGENTNLRIGGSVDLTPVVVDERPVRQTRLNLAVDGTVNLQFASAFYAGLFTDGLARLQITIRGTTKDPQLSGITDIEGATARLINIPVALREGRGRVRFTRDKVLLERFTGRVNEGQVHVGGGLLAKDFQPQRWRLNVRASHVVIRYPEGLRSVLNGELTLQGSRQLQVLSGLMNVQRAEYTQDIDLVKALLEGEPFSTNRPGLTGQATTPLTLDIRVQATDSIFIRNNLADVQASAWLHVGGTIDHPILSGRAVVSRGMLRFRDQEYEVTIASLELPDRPNEELRFNVEAETNISGYQVIIGFSGTPSQFNPTLRSEPPLPPEGVISLITTGRADTITQETQALAQTSVGLATSLISEVLSQQLEQQIARQQFLGINRFQIEPLLQGGDANSTARITVGQQLAPNLSIAYSFNLASNDEPVVILEYKLSNRFSLVGARDEEGRFSLDFRIRKRF